jgi:hypothetical protein
MRNQTSWILSAQSLTCPAESDLYQLLHHHHHPCFWVHAKVMHVWWWVRGDPPLVLDASGWKAIRLPGLWKYKRKVSPQIFRVLTSQVEIPMSGQSNFKQWVQNNFHYCNYIQHFKDECVEYFWVAYDKILLPCVVRSKTASPVTTF